MKDNKEKQNVEIGEVISKTEAFIEKNKKLLTGIIVAILVVVAAIFGIRAYNNSRQATAEEEIFAAEQWFAMDSLQLAMKGNAMHMGFEAIADEYGSTKAGNRAKYCAGIICLRQGEYQRAIDYLESCKLKDDFTPILAKVLIGDAYYELDNVKEAVNYYEKAAKMDDNEMTAPYALFKAGMGYMKLGDNANANEAFTQIKEKYPFSTEARQVDKYIGAAEQLAEE
ncbi:MAG: tetratricopeptide repeat protein [Bacteroidales bacterium]|nr:tetratricopeptide repeat protein [Bacteroidales bacterium]